MQTLGWATDKGALEAREEAQRYAGGKWWASAQGGQSRYGTGCWGTEDERAVRVKKWSDKLKEQLS